MFVDALCMQMVRAPEQFEVIVSNNMFGDILTDLGAALQGGLGVAGSANLPSGAHLDVRAGARLGAEVRRHRQGEPARRDPLHGVDAGEPRPSAAAREIEGLVGESIRSGKTTHDLGGSLTTSEVGDLVARAVGTAGTAAAVS